MTTVGAPLGTNDWWNHCTYPDGSLVHILTSEDIGRYIDDHPEILEDLAKDLHRRFEETLNKIILGGEQNELLIQKQ
jgi:hypothetical protein